MKWFGGWRQANCHTMESMMDLRWLSKLSAMDEARAPRRSPHGAQRLGLDTDHSKAIRHGYITSALEILGFETKQADLEEWTTEARDRPTRTRRVESQLGLPNGSELNIG
jgi:hypothetical protein